ncbi:hypothetical protein lerEdw1_002340 [Lerista edwardsae]|nr:hypothetical protein lerEdw1_002340 [Lerista edwardsae]
MACVVPRATNRGPRLLPPRSQGPHGGIRGNEVESTERSGEARNLFLLEAGPLVLPPASSSRFFLHGAQLMQEIPSPIHPPNTLVQTSTWAYASGQSMVFTVGDSTNCLQRGFREADKQPIVSFLPPTRQMLRFQKAGLEILVVMGIRRNGHTNNFDRGDHPDLKTEGRDLEEQKIRTLPCKKRTCGVHYVYPYERHAGCLDPKVDSPMAKERMASNCGVLLVTKPTPKGKTIAKEHLGLESEASYTEQR